MSKSVTAAKNTSKVPNVTSIAGVDPSGGAGVLADIKTFSALGAFGCAIITALTAQNTQAVSAIHVPPKEFLAAQFDLLFADVDIAANKIGMLGEAAIIETVSEKLRANAATNIIIDPVMVAKSGDLLLAKTAVAALREALFPLAFMITPNLFEAEILLDGQRPDNIRDMRRAAEKLRNMMPNTGEAWVLLKGGHLPGNDLVDLLCNGDEMIELTAKRQETRNTHGTGCTLSSAIAALLPQYQSRGDSVENAVRHAHRYLQHAIAANGNLQVGNGHGPVDHFLPGGSKPLTWDRAALA